MADREQWSVAVLPGDGIGVEVMREAVRVLERLAAAEDGPRLELHTYPWPSHAHHREHGCMMPDDWKAQLAGHDAILLGALGDPGPIEDTERYLLSDGVSLAPLLAIRKGFDLWACERPAVLLEGARQYLADPRAKELDMLVVRENSEGEYVGQGGRVAPGTPREVATQVEVFTRAGTERILRHAFERARARAAVREGTGTPRAFRGPEGAKLSSQVCMVTKRNALAHWGELWVDVFAEVARDYPDVATHHELVDAACMKFVSSPWHFDVVVASNLQGDILTDLAAVLCGGMGVAPSCNLNPSDRSVPPMFEPTHGSAPDIAGRGLAGPHAMLLTAGMMLRWMGEEDPRALRAAAALEAAVRADLKEQPGGIRKTAQVGDAVLARL